MPTAELTALRRARATYASALAALRSDGDHNVTALVVRAAKYRDRAQALEVALGLDPDAPDSTRAMGTIADARAAGAIARAARYAREASEARMAAREAARARDYY